MVPSLHSLVKLIKFTRPDTFIEPENVGYFVGHFLQSSGEDREKGVSNLANPCVMAPGRNRTQYPLVRRPVTLLPMFVEVAQQHAYFFIVGKTFFGALSGLVR